MSINRKMRLRRASGRNLSRRAKSPIKIIAIFAFLLALIFLISTFFVDKKIRPMIELYGHNQAVTTGTQAIHRAVETVINEQSISYEDLSMVHKDSSGLITSIETNAHNMNMIKSAISEKVLEETDKNNVQNVKIPLGSLVGGLLTGRGPSITVKVPMNSTVEIHFRNEFEGAGINQTRHIIGMEVEVTTYIVAQGERVAVEVMSDFVIAERIIVGEVPKWNTGDND